MDILKGIEVTTLRLDVKYLQNPSTFQMLVGYEETTSNQNEILKRLLALVREHSLNPQSKLNQEFWGEVANTLWVHLNQCLEQLDDQLLCATCFYTVISFASTKDQDYYLDQILNIIGTDHDSPAKSIQLSLPGTKRLPSRVKKLNCSKKEINESNCTLRVASLMYGMFQSPFLVKISDEDSQESKVAKILKESFNLLLHMGYEYTDYTFLVFKIVKSFEKVYGGSLEKYIFNRENNVKLLTFVNNNWENPVTGVRDLNRSIFRTVILTLDNETYKQVITEIDGFYWNKAKFLMLADIIDINKENRTSLINYKWIDGLIYSLHKPGLVSAGADMYYALLKIINTQDDWCQFFLLHIVNIFKGANIKAIDNFCNYWCTTTMKKFRTLAEVLIDELEQVEDSEQVLYSKLYVMKQANKLGILNKNWDLTIKSPIENAVLTGIEQNSNHMRMLAFDIICVSPGKLIPSLLEYNLILDYLHNNVNSDSTVLRLSMLNSFSYFLTQLHSTFLNVLMKSEGSENMKNLLNFCQRLQILIENNITVYGNYQRKITILKLFDSIVLNFNVISRKRKTISQNSNKTLLRYLKENNFWQLSSESFLDNLTSLLKDPADDVRDTVIKILLSQFPNEFKNLWMKIKEEADQFMKSKYFYEISCSQSMFKLICIFGFISSDRDIHYKNIGKYYEDVYSKLITQHAAKTNVLDSIEKGQQLHSYINILLTIYEECLSRKSNSILTVKLIEKEKMPLLIQVLENISNQFAWEEEGSSDFSEMNDMINNIIATSAYRPVNEDDVTHISGLQQIVLNCMWLNVKASCDLASILIQYLEDIDDCKKCVNIIMHVLETSRHKGAIEAAGAALGRAIQYLTMPKCDSSLPFNLLKSKLGDMISETNKMSSVTRRGAGLSIMFHRMVSNDMAKGKPLFHYFTKTLLEACKQSKQLPKSTGEGKASQVDIPIAIYIHFMTRIVTDSSLATDVMSYSTELAKLAFENLTSSHWQIRNAALQLYGALVPRLIGQKKASGTEEVTIATVACDELRTHLPKIWTYIVSQLKQNIKEDLIQAHSNLVPILNILANSAKRYNLSLQIVEEEIEFVDLFYYLISLLNSPIYTVRRLTAKAIFNIYDFEYITDGMLKQKILGENQLHGILILLNLCYNYYTADSNFKIFFGKLGDKFDEIFNTGSHSYLSRKLYEDVYLNDIDMKDVENTISELNANSSPGIQVWAEARLKKYINKCNWPDVPSLLKNIILQQENYEKYLLYFEPRFEHTQNIPTDVLLEITAILFEFEKRYSSSVIWKILYEISKKTNLCKCINAEELLKKMKENVSYNLRYMVPLIARYIGNSNNDNKESLIKIINGLSDFENSDVDMRYIASIANNEIAHEFNTLPDSIKVMSIKCAVLLLQDEDEDVRNLSVNFYSIVSDKDKKRTFQPYICLNTILDKKFLNSAFTDPQNAIKELQIQLNKIIHLNHKVDKYNPFTNDFKNIYFEPHILKQVLEQLDV